MNSDTLSSEAGGDLTVAEKGSGMIHSRFSPASMPSELLERTFVQREKLAERLTDLFTESALGDSKHHVLLVGPRGIGKSHLVALVYHRLNKRDDLKDKLLIAYLREDEWGITSFLDLLVRVLRAIGADTSALTNLNPSTVEQQAWNMLRERIAGKTLLVILENLGGVLRNLGEAGQKKWRALIQTYPCWAVLATTPALSSDISQQASPFYGFFEIQNLPELSVSEAVALLTQLARVYGDEKTAEFVATPAGRARVRAVHHLAGGNHRVFVIFYDFLSQDRPDTLLEPLLKTIDSLTPYYQSQMDKLSPQQRKLVEFLCEHRGAATVKAIASGCFITHQTAAAQLKQLLEARYVQVTRLGRESYYELAEPLLRICVEVKTHDPEPLRLLVEFLRYWFSRDELQEKFSSAELHSFTRSYIAAALREYDTTESRARLGPQISELFSVMSKAAKAEDSTAMTTAAEELAEVSKRAEVWGLYAMALLALGRDGEALPVIHGSLEKNSHDPFLRFALSIAYQRSGQNEEALSVCEDAIGLSPRADYLWLQKGLILEELGRDKEALQAYSTAARLTPPNPMGWAGKGQVLLRMKRFSQAKAACERAFNLDPENVFVSRPYCQALFSTGEHRQAVEKLPAQVVSDVIVEEFVSIYSKRHSPDLLRAELFRWHSLLEGEPGLSAFTGGFLSVMGHVCRQPGTAALASFRPWIETLGEILGQSPMLEAVRGLFDIALRYRETADEKILMELPLELRKLLK
jgi:tetratricopeptide (TPR) repeat protein